MNRDLYALTPEIRELALKFLKGAEKENLEVLIYSTHRTLKAQAKSYRQGRTIGAIMRKADELDIGYKRPDLAAVLLGVGPQHETNIVTYAGPGQSLHSYRMAFDGVPILNDRLIWDRKNPLWKNYGGLITKVGLLWYGSLGKWDITHSQDKRVNWRDLIESYRFD